MSSDASRFIANPCVTCGPEQAGSFHLFKMTTLLQTITIETFF
jgi:hypothetical protein